MFRRCISKSETKLRRLSTKLRRLSTAIRPHIDDEGDWFYSSEWWGNGSDGHTVFRETSDEGNGVVSVVAYPSSRPNEMHWPKTERWLNQRYKEIHPGSKDNEQFRILGYQWRTLRFNDYTRQSTVKLMAASKESDAGQVIYMPQAHCLAVPYLKSMISAGLASISSRNYDLRSAVCGKKSMNILCIGHGGGSLPLFLASAILGAVVDVVEIDPLVISASTQAMGFPSFSIMTQSGTRARPKPYPIDEVLWKGVHERLHLYQADAEDFIIKSTTIYDAVFIDAYDGEDIFPHKLWDPHSPFLLSLAKQVHPEHGTIVVNLHSDADVLDGPGPSDYLGILPMGKYVSSVCRSYRDVVIGDGRGLGFTVAVPWVCNSTLVVCRGFKERGDMALNTLMGKSLEVDNIMNFPFSCLQYLKNGYVLVD